jgi:ABC-type transporter Mla subunit MlaD
MTTISFSITSENSGEAANAFLIVFQHRQWLQEQFNGITLQLQSLQRGQETIMSKADELRAAQADTSREVGQIVEFINTKQKSLDEALKTIEDLRTQDVSDAELRDAVDELLPKMRSDVDTLNQFTPETTGDGGATGGTGTGSDTGTVGTGTGDTGTGTGDLPAEVIQ